MNKTIIFLTILLITKIALVRAQNKAEFIQIYNGCSIYPDVWFQLTTDDYKIKWTGNCNNGYANGYGKLTKTDSDNYLFNTYIGNMVNGKKQGKGVLTTLGGYKYDGEWSNNEQHGKGTSEHLMRDGQKNIHSGYYRNGKKHGYGTEIYPGDWTKTGEWINNNFINGTMTWTDGTYTKGTYKESWADLINGAKYFKDGNVEYYVKDGIKKYSEVALLRKKVKDLENQVAQQKQSPTSSSNSSPSSNSNNSEMEKRYNRERPCKIEKEGTPEWHNVDDSVPYMYFDFIVHVPEENGQYKEVSARISQIMQRNQRNRTYFNIESPFKTSYEIKTFEEAFKNIIEHCKCNGVTY